MNAMKLRQDVLASRYFWWGYYTFITGLPGVSLDSCQVCEWLGVAEPTAHDWWDDFAGWYPGVLDEADGQVDDPATVKLSLANRIDLLIQFHPGDWYYLLHREGENPVQIGNNGPHFQMPVFRWNEIKTLAEIAAPNFPGESGRAIALLLLFPTVWMTDDDDAGEVAIAIEQAWLETRFVSAEDAQPFAKACREMIGAPSCRWQQDSDRGWVTDATNSMRALREPVASVRHINRLLIDAVTI